MPFRPKIGDELKIGANLYRFTEHPSARRMPYGQTGRRATVYQLVDTQGHLHALKVFTQAFRSPQTEEQAARIAQFSAIPGLAACQRVVLNPQVHPGVIQQYPDLKYAVLMPWVRGVNWQEIIISRRALTPDACKRLSEALIGLLVLMEQRGLAHCDLSGSNVLLEVNEGSEGPSISLIDLEDLFAPGLNPPGKLPAGSAGYGHAQVRTGIWSAEADRFAGAVLFAEMLCWCDERVRRISFGEQYFDPSEMQTASERYQILLQVLRERWGQHLAELFSRAWFSSTLSDCPGFTAWARALNPPPDPDALIAHMQRAERLGRWAEVLALCNEVQRVDPNRTEVSPARARAQRMLHIEASIQAAWQKAAVSGLTADWEDCLKVVSGAQLIASQVVRYQGQREQVENELETALRMDDVEQLLQFGRWEEARRSLQAISPIQPRYTELMSQIEEHFRVAANIEKSCQEVRLAAAASDWQQVLVKLQALEKVRPLDVEMADLRRRAEEELARERALREALARAEAAQRAGDEDAALQEIDRILVDWPDLSYALQLRAQIEHARTSRKAASECMDKAQSLVGKGKLQDALDVLSGLAEETTEVRQLRETLQQRLEWRRRLEAAIQTWRLPEVLHLLDQRPAEEDDRPDLRKWVEEIGMLEDQLQSAQKAGDLEREISLLEQLPQNYPSRDARLTSRNREHQIFQVLMEGMRAYDLDQVRQIQGLMVPSDPRCAVVAEWIQTEIDRRQTMEYVFRSGDLSEAHHLLAKLPQDHPLRPGLENWLFNESALRDQIMSVVEGYRLDEWADLLAGLPANHPLEKPLRLRLEEETARAERIEWALKLYDGQTVLNEVDDVEPDYPGYAELRAWAESELNRQAEIQRVVLAGDVHSAEVLLAGLPSDHPLQLELQDWLDQQMAASGPAESKTAGEPEELRAE